MTGNYILENRPSHFHRIDFVLTAERYLGIATLIVGLTLSYYFYTLSAYPASATVFAFTLGLSGYVLTATYNRHIQITEYAERTLTMLQEPGIFFGQIRFSYHALHRAGLCTYSAKPTE
jgi:hypothetical protein